MTTRKIFAALFALAAFASFAFDAQTSRAEDGYSVDFTKKVGAIKNLNGANLWAPLSNSRKTKSQDAAVLCHMPTIRLHDVPLDNAGMRLVDVQHIFGNETADPNDPANYYFTQTDDYIQRIIDGGSAPIYRLGTSIEHSANTYYAKAPKDPQHYADVCAGIVRHYNEGWANGFRWNIEYWEIWNEPDNTPAMWDTNDWNVYCEFYVVVAKRLRKEFPTIKIGGPALTNANIEKIQALAKKCKAEDAPLDFVSWHCYPKTPSQVLDTPAKVRAALDELGFTKTELHLNEWHYLPCGFKGIQGALDEKIYWYESPVGIHGYVSAAFNDFVLTRWQDAPLDMANYYTYNSKNWGTHDHYGRTRLTFYSLSIFGDIATFAPQRVETIDKGGNVALLGGINEAGTEKRLLVSIFQREETEPIEIAIKGAPENANVKALKIDSDGYKEVEFEYENGLLQLDSKDSGVYYVYF